MLSGPLKAELKGQEDDELPSLHKAFLYQEGDRTKGIPHNYKKAFRTFMAIAQDPETIEYSTACFYVGLYYDMGCGVKQSDTKAKIWYTKAAIAGHREAWINLCILTTYAQVSPKQGPNQSP